MIIYYIYLNKIREQVANKRIPTPMKNKKNNYENNKNELIQINQKQFDNIYTFIQLIDQGAYGYVVKYKNNKTEEFVACKFLCDQQEMESFFKQQWLMKQIQHQNVLKCISIYHNQTKNKKILVTQYCQKYNLQKCLKQLKNKDEKFKIGLCVQIVRGINAIHQKNIIHRDVKPQNLLITKNWIVKLCDFGIGRLDNDLTKSKKIGTPLYRDPNILSGHYTKKCDIYSVGLVFDTIFRGKSVFNASSQQQLTSELQYFKQHKRQIIDNNNCCSQLKSIIFDCLEQQQQRRPDSVVLLNRIQQLWQNSQKGLLSSNQWKGKREVIQYEQHEENNRQYFWEKYSNSNSLFCQQIQSQEIIKLPEEQDILSQKQFKIQKKISMEIKCLEELQQLDNNNNNNNNNDNNNNNNNNNKNNKNNNHNNNNNNNNNDDNFNLLTKLTKVTKKCNQNLQQKIKQIQIQQYFNKIQNNIKQLIFLVRNNVKLYEQNKKTIVFIALFGYLRFLMQNKTLLQNKSNCKIPDIQEISLSYKNMSEKAAQICLAHIQKQSNIIKNQINKLSNHKDYGQILQKNQIKMMILIKNQKLENILNFQYNVIKEQYLKIFNAISMDLSFKQIKIKLQSCFQLLF